MMGFTALERCDGCGQCELACAFRATETFWLPASAIRLKKSASPEEPRCLVWVDPEECDLCETEAQPACQRYCKSNALSREVLTRLLAMATVH